MHEFTFCLTHREPLFANCVERRTRTLQRRTETTSSRPPTFHSMTFRRATFTCLMTSLLGKGDLYKEISVSGAVSTVLKQ